MSVPAGVSPDKLSAVVENVNKASDVHKVISQVAQRDVGTIYVVSNTYIALPSYFSQEVKRASITFIQ